MLEIQFVNISVYFLLTFSTNNGVFNLHDRVAPQVLRNRNQKTQGQLSGYLLFKTLIFVCFSPIFFPNLVGIVLYFLFMLLYDEYFVSIFSNLIFKDLFQIFYQLAACPTLLLISLEIILQSIFINKIFS